MSLADFVNRDDVRMVEGRGRSRLLFEATHAPDVGRELGGQQLDRHLAPQPCVESEWVNIKVAMTLPLVLMAKYAPGHRPLKRSLIGGRQCDRQNRPRLAWIND